MNNDKNEFWVHTRPGIFLLNSIILLITDLVIFPRHGWGRLNEPLSQNGTWISGILNFFSNFFNFTERWNWKDLWEWMCHDVMTIITIFPFHAISSFTYSDTNSSLDLVIKRTPSPKTVLVYFLGVLEGNVSRNSNFCLFV